MIAVDLGCADRGEWFSLEALVEKYSPSFIYGFDPSPNLDTTRKHVNGVRCKLERKAAWTHDGTVGFSDEFTPGTRGVPIGFGPPGQPYGRIGYIHPEPGGEVPCFDFAKWLKRRKQPVVVKMDIEGAEYDLLDHLIATGANKKVALLIMEWHDTESGERIAAMGCPYQRWWM